MSGEQVVTQQNISCELDMLEKKVYNIGMKMPYENGKYKLVAEIIYKNESVKSIREFIIE